MSHIEATNHRPPSGYAIQSNKRIRSRRQRRQLRKLLAYGDRTLSDLGYSRDQIHNALRIRCQDKNAFVLNNIHQQNMHPEQLRVRH